MIARSATTGLAGGREWKGEHCSSATEGDRAQGRRCWEQRRLLEGAVITDVARAVRVAVMEGAAIDGD